MCFKLSFIAWFLYFDQVAHSTLDSIKAFPWLVSLVVTLTPRRHSTIENTVRVR